MTNTAIAFNENHIAVHSAIRSKRIPELDGLRGIAILMVVYFHYVAALRSFDVGSIGHLLDVVGRLGWSGVDLFFVLSGFLIGGILLDNRNSPNLFRVFYTRRALRIMPLYFAVVILGVFMASTIRSLNWGGGQYLPGWMFFLFVQNIFTGLRGSWSGPVLSPTWSLAVEEQFYLIVPVVITFLSPRKLRFFAIALITTAPAVRWFFRDIGYVNFTIVRWDSLLMGIALAMFGRREDFPRIVHRFRNALLAVCIILIGVLVASTLADVTYLHGPSSVWIFSVLGVFFVIVMIAALWPTETPFRMLLRWRPLTRLGTISFGVYLFHFPSLFGFHRILRHASPAINSWSALLVTVLALCATLLLAEVSYRFFESPLVGMGHRFKYVSNNA